MKMVILNPNSCILGEVTKRLQDIFFVKNRKSFNFCLENASLKAIYIRLVDWTPMLILLFSTIVDAGEQSKYLYFENQSSHLRELAYHI